MFGIPVATLIGVGIRLALVAAVVIACTYAVHRYNDSIRAPIRQEMALQKQAYEDTIKVDEATIRTQGASLATSMRIGGECSASVKRIAGVAENAGKELELERARSAAKDKQRQASIDRNTAIAAGPPTVGDSCAAARKIGADYAREVRAK